MGAAGISCFLYLIVMFILVCKASEGDRSPFYQKCVAHCLTTDCSDDDRGFLEHAAKKLDIWSKVLMWQCKDECRYHCMWKVVTAFDQRGYGVPKFHGKWPFVRLFGIQEPASAFASLLNLIFHVFMNTRIRRQFNTRNMPVLYLWHAFTAICVHAWLWSFIFHTRDTPFTEFMDYACALSMVMALFLAAVIRLFYRRRLVCAGAVLLTILYFMDHSRYLYTGLIDYNYNMIVNIVFGVAGSLVWIIWSLIQYMSGQRYVWRMVLFTLLSGCVLALELGDFPPEFGWDAHAVWHLSTVALIPLFYRCIIDDLEYLQGESYVKQKL